MGTLTAQLPRLPSYCDHKLPTSCRLSSIPLCCACADERPHAATYSTYIDGVGFVQRGTRWQRYCWFCKEFWENRVKASGLRAGQTRIPDAPDQGEFLGRWYEFYQGWRDVRKEDGGVERVEVLLGEEFGDVSPGFLPRTVEEVREGRGAGEVVGGGQQERGQERVVEDTGPSLEDTLDSMFQAAEAEGEESEVRLRDRAQRSPEPEEILQQMREGLARHTGGSQQNNVHAQAIHATGSRNREYQSRRIAALRRELHRMRNGIERVISGLRDLGENVPDHSEATGRLTDLGRTLDSMNGIPTQEEDTDPVNNVNTSANDSVPSQTDRTLATMQTRVDEARSHFDQARRIRDQAASELDLAEQEYRTSQQRLQHTQREQRTAENYMRLFGTREEMQEQGDSYESPIGGMFTRAYERFRVAEEVRREERTLRQVLEDEARAGGEEASRRIVELETQERDLWGVPRPPEQQPLRQYGLPDTDRDLPIEARSDLEEYYELVRRQNRNQQAPQLQAPSETTGTEEFPRSMLNAVMAERDRDHLDIGEDQLQNSLSPPPQLSELEAPVPDSSSRDQNDEQADHAHVLLYLIRDSELRAENMFTADEASGLLRDSMNRELTLAGWSQLADLRERPRLVWRSGMIAARLSRRRRAGVRLALRENVPQDDFQLTAENIELMAEAYQRSAELRRRAEGLTPPQQLQMLYRLQAGERQLEDVAKLHEMLADEGTFALASEITDMSAQNDAIAAVERAERLSRLEEQRRSAAREGDHSRRELDAQRQATRALAVAAGRTAMRTGPTALLEQMASRDAETRAAYERLQQNGFVPQGDSAAERRLRESMYRPLTFINEFVSEDEEEGDDEQGLDARDSGRPEPRAEEELSVNLECRICYTQLAEIACLPCGHLVMCKWCSEQHSPVMAHDRTRPRRAAGCPACRKGIRQKVRVFRA